MNQRVSKKENLTYEIGYRTKDNRFHVVFFGCKSYDEALSMLAVKQVRYKHVLSIR